MPLRRNPQVPRLLSWHGHDSGGVHVPFQRNSSPLGQTIDTRLMLRLRQLSKSIAGGKESPRWIFLIGGPGNGKSETVQDFLTCLDEDLGMQGRLRDILADKFKPNPLSARRVAIDSSDVASAPGNFAASVGRLIVVQDATATDEASGNAAEQLVLDIADVLNSQGMLPLFVVCANRGLLSRALRESLQKWGTGNPVTKLIVELIQTSSIGFEASYKKKKLSSCWPLEYDTRAACWPLDLESLLVTPGASLSPAEQVIATAARDDDWKVCADCDSSSLCPFRQNAAWLQDSGGRRSYLKILRRGELYTGQRWNFRNMFSLVAETMVGQWSDFESSPHPCDWVHEQVNQLENASRAPAAIAPTYALLQRLYPHALFSRVYPNVTGRYEDSENWDRYEISRAVIAAIAITDGSTAKPIREILLGGYSDLDPAAFTPSAKDHILREIEDEYSQSIELGNAAGYLPSFSLLESRFLRLLEQAETEWNQDLLGRRSFHAFYIVHLLRKLACTMVKRSVGVRLGHHAYEEYLAEYEVLIRDSSKLNRIKDTLQSLLGERELAFNILESFGQPQTEEAEELVEQITLKSVRTGIRTKQAPPISGSLPAHDVPFFEIGSDYRVPITFDFYRALCLRNEGCSSSSLPASVRAAIDRVRHQYAGELCRNKGNIVDGITSIVIGKQKKIELSDESAEPSLADL